MPKKKKPLNPLIQSVAEVRKLEFDHDIKLAYDYAQSKLGEQFEDHMKVIAEEIISLQKECKAGTSYYIAGLLLTIPPDDEPELTEEDNDDFAFYTMLVKAAIGWGAMNGYK